MELLLTFASVLSFIFSASVMTSNDLSASQPRTMRTIFNFNSEDTFSAADANSWWESSDTVREPGKSKASFVLQKSRLFQRAVFFAMLNPQPNGAGFAGVKTNISLSSEDLAGATEILLQARAQGSLANWKVVLTNSEFHDQQAAYSYEAKFPVTLDSESFERIQLPLSEFKAYYRGSVVEDAPPLDMAKFPVTLESETFERIQLPL